MPRTDRPGPSDASSVKPLTSVLGRNRPDVPASQPDVRQQTLLVRSPVVEQTQNRPGQARQARPDHPYPCARQTARRAPTPNVVVIRTRTSSDRQQRSPSARPGQTGSGRQGASTGQTSTSSAVTVRLAPYACRRRTSSSSPGPASQQTSQTKQPSTDNTDQTPAPSHQARRAPSAS